MTTDDRTRIWSAIRSELPRQVGIMALLTRPFNGATWRDGLDQVARDLADAVVRVMEGKR